MADGPPEARASCNATRRSEAATRTISYIRKHLEEKDPSLGFHGRAPSTDLTRWSTHAGVLLLNAVSAAGFQPAPLARPEP